MARRATRAKRWIALAAAEDEQWLRDELLLEWRAAEAEATVAYEAWCDEPGPDAYAVYRAAQDRADQAQDLLNAAPRRHALAAAG